MSCKRNRGYRIFEAVRVRSCPIEPNGAWDFCARTMTQTFEEASRPIFFCWTILVGTEGHKRPFDTPSQHPLRTDLTPMHSCTVAVLVHRLVAHTWSDFQRIRVGSSACKRAQDTRTRTILFSQLLVGDLKSKKGKQTIHFQGTTQTKDNHDSYFGGMQSVMHFCRTVCLVWSIQPKQRSSSSWRTGTFQRRPHELDTPQRPNSFGKLNARQRRQQHHCSSVTRGKISQHQLAGVGLGYEDDEFGRTLFYWSLDTIETESPYLFLVLISRGFKNPYSFRYSIYLRHELHLRELDAAEHWPKMTQRMYDPHPNTWSWNLSMWLDAMSAASDRVRFEICLDPHGEPQYIRSIQGQSGVPGIDQHYFTLLEIPHAWKIHIYRTGSSHDYRSIVEGRTDRGRHQWSQRRTRVLFLSYGPSWRCPCWIS